MPIGGGTFTVQNKILPGAYINFVSMGTNAKMGSRGVAALPLELNWGPDDKVFTMTATDFNATSLKVFGYDPIVKGQKKRQYNKVQRAKRPPAGTSIENRPKEIDDRAVVGDWEMDCVEGKKKTKKTLLVLTERKSRREIIRPMRDQTARSVVRVLDSLEREYGANFSKIFRTITVDNGSEFADCAGMEKSCRRKGNRTKIYYCHPYSSYERGSNENVNKMIRRWFPKGTDFRKVTAKAIQRVEDWINNYPREILGFRTAEAVFQEGVAGLI